MEHDPNLLAATSAFLCQTSCTICGLRSGKQALAFLREHTADAVILNHSLPSVNGYAAAPEIRKLWPAIQIVICADSASDEHREVLDAWRNKNDGVPALLTRVGEIPRDKLPIKNAEESTMRRTRR